MGRKSFTICRMAPTTVFLTLDEEADAVPNDQRWFHHPDMQARIALSEREFAEGRSTRTETPEEAQALLDSLKRRS